MTRAPASADELTLDEGEEGEEHEEGEEQHPPCVLMLTMLQAHPAAGMTTGGAAAEAEAAASAASILSPPASQPDIALPG